MSVKPNLEGFADSRRRLREAFGQEITFLLPDSATYPAATTDPESGESYDPWATPVSGGGADTQVVKTVSVVNRPLGGVKDTVAATPIGNLAEDVMALILPFDEWPDVAEATHFVYLDDRYKITEARDDAMATVYRRKIIYGTKS